MQVTGEHSTQKSIRGQINVAVEPVDNNIQLSFKDTRRGELSTVQERPTMKSAQSQSRMPESGLPIKPVCTCHCRRASKMETWVSPN